MWSKDRSGFTPHEGYLSSYKVLAEKEWLNKMQPEDFRGLTPLFYGHVNPYGKLILNMNERITI